MNMPDEGDPLAIAKSIEINLRESGSDVRLAHLDDLVRYAYARLGSLEEAEDVAIETLQAAAQRAGGLESIREPKLYLLGIARRKTADQLRRNRKQRGKDTVAIEDLGEQTISGPEPEIGLAVRQVLQQLPELYQEV